MESWPDIVHGYHDAQRSEHKLWYMKPRVRYAGIFGAGQTMAMLEPSKR